MNTEKQNSQNETRTRGAHTAQRPRVTARADRAEKPTRAEKPARAEKPIRAEKPARA